MRNNDDVNKDLPTKTLRCNLLETRASLFGSTVGARWLAEGNVQPPTY